MSGRSSKDDAVAPSRCLTARTALDNAPASRPGHDAEGRTKPLSGAHDSDVMGEGLKPFHAA